MDGGATGGETSPPSRHINYKMASNFELGDEQPANPTQQANRRRSKPSGEIGKIIYGKATFFC
jgi:hypothetical protein